METGFVKEQMTKKEMRKRIYAMILPISLENVLQMLAGFVAMAMIGRISTIAIGAVGLSMRITQIVWAIFKGVTTGATIFAAQAYGAQDSKRLRQVVQQTLLSVLLFVIGIQQLIYWKAPLLVHWLGGKDELLEKGTLYLRTISWGLPFMAIMLVVAGVLQGMGNAKTPMKIAFIMNGVNIVGNYLLIYGNFGFPSLGIRGSAMATAFAQFIGAVIGLYILFGKGGTLEGLFSHSFFRPDWRRISEIYRLGTPTAMESIFWQFCTILLTKLILTFGEVALAAHQLGIQAEAISYMPAMGFSIAATAFVGQSLGAKEPAMAKKYLKEIVQGSVVLTSISMAILLFLPYQVMGLLTNQVEVIRLGAVYLMLMAFVQIPQNLAGVLYGAMRGAGFTKAPMIVAGTGLWLVRLPLAYILSIGFRLNIYGIWYAITFDMAFRFILSYLLYKRKNIYGEESKFQTVND
ncbi:MATE family efflux transporter [Geosporobacter ferrireducens]|nr:MATE family efflux transporter [Geosporobacter ferrireducens]